MTYFDWAMSGVPEHTQRSLEDDEDAVELMLTVRLTDVFQWGNEYDIIEWARENCPSFITHDSIDVSDVSNQYDTIDTFTFTEEQDVSWFLLKWKR